MLDTEATIGRFHATGKDDRVYGQNAPNQLICDRIAQESPTDKCRKTEN
jgi:hypothetical protein